MGRGIRRSRHALATTPSALSPASLGARLKAARERACLTQAQAGAPRYSAPYVSAVENRHHFPSLEALTFLARNLQVPASDLLDQPPNVPAAGALATALGSVDRELSSATDERRAVLLAVAFVLREALPRLSRTDTN